MAGSPPTSCAVGGAWRLASVVLLLAVVHAAGPHNAQNLTVISLRPYNQSADLTNKDSADAGGDLFFYITDRFVQPYGCRHSNNSEWYCSDSQRKLIDGPNQVYTQVVVAVDPSFGGCPSGDVACAKYADCNPDSSGDFRCSCSDSGPRCWGTPPNRHCYTPTPCNVTGKVTIASRYCSLQGNGTCAQCADGCRGL
jgi:hypothetical protein